MSNNTAPLALGALTAMAVSSRDYRDRDSDDRRETNRQSTNALTLARGASVAIDALVENGDIIRIGVDTTSDFLLGLTYGGNREDAAASALPTVPTALVRPIIAESLAVAPQQWPPAVNDYDRAGKLVNPASWLDGQNTLTGLLIGFAETRAFLAGLSRNSHPDSFTQAQFYRAARGLSNALEAGAHLNSRPSQAQYDAAWAKLFGLSAGLYGPGIVYAQVTDGAPVANSTAEFELAEVPWPHGFLANVGDVAEVIFGGVIAGSSTMTGRIRLDQSGGNSALAQLNIAVTASVTRQQRLVITRRADVNGNETYECCSDNSDVAVQDIVTLVPGSDHKIVWSGQWAAAAAGNTATAKTAVLRKY